MREALNADAVMAEAMDAGHYKTLAEAMSAVWGMKSINFTREAALSTIKRVTTEELARGAVAAVYDQAPR